MQLSKLAERGLGLGRRTGVEAPVPPLREGEVGAMLPLQLLGFGPHADPAPLPTGEGRAYLKRLEAQTDALRAHARKSSAKPGVDAPVTVDCFSFFECEEHVKPLRMASRGVRPRFVRHLLERASHGCTELLAIMVQFGKLTGGHYVTKQIVSKVQTVASCLYEAEGVLREYVTSPDILAEALTPVVNPNDPEERTGLRCVSHPDRYAFSMGEVPDGDPDCVLVVLHELLAVLCVGVAREKASDMVGRGVYVTSEGGQEALDGAYEVGEFLGQANRHLKAAIVHCNEAVCKNGFLAPQAKAVIRYRARRCAFSRGMVVEWFKVVSGLCLSAEGDTQTGSALIVGVSQRAFEAVGLAPKHYWTAAKSAAPMLAQNPELGDLNAKVEAALGAEEAVDVVDYLVKAQGVVS